MDCLECYERGLLDGNEKGWKDCSALYEPRLRQLMVELLELNARVSVVAKRLEENK